MSFEFYEHGLAIRVLDEAVWPRDDGSLFNAAQSDSFIFRVRTSAGDEFTMLGERGDATRCVDDGPDKYRRRISERALREAQVRRELLHG